MIMSRIIQEKFIHIILIKIALECRSYFLPLLIGKFDDITMIALILLSSIYQITWYLKLDN